MSDESRLYERVSEIVAGAHQLGGAELESHLDDACGDDAAIRARVCALLEVAGDDDSAALGEPQLQGGRVFLDALVDAEVPAWLPNKIGDYTILRQIGQGGMGVVYEGTQQSPRRAVAIKLLHPIHATEDRMRRFRREAELLGRLQHPSIAQIYEASSYDVGRGPQPFFAMELVNGADIRAHCSQQGLSRDTRIELLAKVADAVHYAHELGVVHRDLKPDNVLINERGQPRVLDFGIARATDHSPLSTMLTEKGQIVGTLGYMAPEQLTGVVDDVSRSVDVYALGVMAFELLTLRLPFLIAGSSIPKAIATLTGTTAPRAGQLDSTLRGDVETILGKALDVDPARRYESAAALASDLRCVLAHRPIQARPPSRAYLAKKFTLRHRALVGGTLATMLALLLGTSAAIILAGQAQEQRDIAKASENRAINSVLQSTQILIDVDRGLDAAAQLQLVPESARGIAWQLLDRAAPFMIAESPCTTCVFIDDERLLRLGSHGLQDYSLRLHRVSRELFVDAGIFWLAPDSSGHVIGAATEDEALLLDLEREVVLKRSPLHIVRGDHRTWPGLGTDGQGGAVPHTTYRFPEARNNGRTVLWYTSDRDAEVRVDDAVVRVIRNLTVNETAHLGPDGHLLVVNRATEVSVTDIASGAVCFRYVFGPGPGASGSAVRDGVILQSLVEQSPWNTRHAWRRFDLTDRLVCVVPSDPFAVGFTSPHRSPHKVSYPADGRFLVATPSFGGNSGAFAADSTSGAPLPFAALANDGIGTSNWWPFVDGVSSRVTVSPSGCRLVVYGDFGQDYVVELDPRDRVSGFDQPVMTLHGHAHPTNQAGSRWVYHVAVSNDGSLIASAAPSDPHIRVWDTRSGDCVATLERDCGRLRDANPGSWQALMAFDASGDHLILTTPYGGKGLCLLDWDLVEGEVVLQAEPLPIEANHLLLLDRFIEVLSPQSKARLNQRVQMHDDRAMVVYQPPAPGVAGAPRPPEGERWRYVPGIEEQAQGVSVHPTKPHAAVVQQRVFGTERMGRLSIVDPQSGKVLLERDLTQKPWCAAYSPDGSVLAIGTNLGRVLLFETGDYTRQLDWGAHESAGYSYVHSLAWTPDGTRLVTASGDETVRIWDTRTRVASRLEHDRWTKLRAAMVGIDGLWQARKGMVGEERDAATAELIRRANGR